jgi:hypothetical protein
VLEWTSPLGQIIAAGAVAAGAIVGDAIVDASPPGPRFEHQPPPDDGDESPPPF